jgi:hypothetical protein
VRSRGSYNPLMAAKSLALVVIVVVLVVKCAGHHPAPWPAMHR